MRKPLAMAAVLAMSVFLTATGVFADTFSNVKDAGQYLREQLKARSAVVLIDYTVSGETDKTIQEKAKEIRTQIYEEAIRFTGKGDEGDYLKTAMKDITKSVSSAERAGDTYKLVFKFVPEYFDSLKKEQRVGVLINSILSALNLNGKSDLEKTEAVYDWLTKTAFFDTKEAKEHVDTAKNYDSYTAYGAGVLHKSVCQGFASVMYRLCNYLGVECHIVTGTADSGNGPEPHAWLVVKIGGKYYQCDPTWDSTFAHAKKDWRYFLLDRIPGHVMDDIYVKAYPCSSTPYTLTKTLTVRGGTGTGKYKQGTIVTISAVTNGNKFVRWDGSVTFVNSKNTDATARIRIDKNATVTAVTTPVIKIAGTHRIRLSNGKYLAIKGNSKKTNAKAFAGKKSAKSSKFKFEKVGKKYRIKNVYSGKYLKAKESDIIQVPKSKSTKWTIVKSGNWYRIKYGKKAINKNAKLTKDKKGTAQKILLTA